MEAFGVLKLWRNASAGADDVSRNEAFGTVEDDESGDEDSFFDLVLHSPDRAVGRRGGSEAAKKEFEFVESPRDVSMMKNDFLNSKPSSPFALPPSNPKFGVFFTLGFRKSSKCEKTESNAEFKGTPPNQSSKSTRIESSNYSKCRADDMPVDSSLDGDSTLRSQLLKEISDCETSSDQSSRYLVAKYLKVIKPMYLKFWKWQKEKAKFATSSLTNSSSQMTAPVNSSARKYGSERSRVGSFKIATKHLGKSRSASPAVRVAPSPACRRDDSLLEKHDGIQGAVLYCKKSYYSSSKEISQLFRSSSDPSHEKSRHQWRNSCEEPTRCSI